MGADKYGKFPEDEMTTREKAELFARLLAKTLELKRLSRERGEVVEGIHCALEAIRIVKGRAH